jgi:hypothetical protein
LICGSPAHNPVGTNQNHKLGRALNNVKYLFMVLLYLLAPFAAGWLEDCGAAAPSLASQLRISSTSF